MIGKNFSVMQYIINPEINQNFTERILHRSINFLENFKIIIAGNVNFIKNYKSDRSPDHGPKTNSLENYAIISTPIKSRENLGSVISNHSVGKFLLFVI